MLYISLVLLAAAAGYGIHVFNRLVQLRQAVARSWSNIDVLLKQRHDELGKLIEVCRAYTQFERGVLEQVTQARAAAMLARERGDVSAIGAAEQQLRPAIGGVLATVEAYPDLKANQALAHLAARVTGLENALADRREFYNEEVTRNNVRINTFPDLLVARVLRFGPCALLAFADDEKADARVEAG